jgi:sigma-E factor negative regulatory protein RseC
MAEQGSVKEFHTDGTVTVCLKRTDACGKCRACLSFGDSEMIVRAKNPDGANVGDVVSLFVDARLYRKAVLLMYVWPLVAALVGAVLGYYGAGLFGGPYVQDMMGFVCALGFAAMAYLLVNAREKHIDSGDELPVARLL